MKKFAALIVVAVVCACGAVLFAPVAVAQPASARAAAPYAQGLLWKIESAGAAPSYLFGTIHVSDPRVTVLPPPVRQTFEAAATFTMELKFEPGNALQLANRMLYLDGRELPAVIGAALYEKVAAVAPTIGVPAEVLRRFKPWAVALLLIMPQSDAENILDNRLYQLALAQKKGVFELETVDEQVEAFEGLAESDQIALLRSAVANRERLPARVQRLIDAYLRRDLAEFMRISDEDAAGDPAMKRLNAAFMERLLDARNVRMAERMESQLKSGRAFVAIGALHLYGERGVLARLASRGYRVSRVY